MLLSPLQNGAVKVLNWIQTRPTITQLFGANPDVYGQFGMNGHNGIDFAVPTGTPIFAPCDGDAIFSDDGNGYGKHCKIRSPHGPREIVLGHFSKYARKNGKVSMGDLIAYSGNTGFSSGPHLHFGMRKLIESNGNIWQWSVKDYSNGYKGYIDIIDYVITWKGGLNIDQF